MFISEKKSKNFRTFFYLICSFTFLFLISCANPFETRQVETPDQGSDNYILPTLPGELLDNIIIAFDTKDFILYAKSFRDTLASDFYFYYVGDIANAPFLGHWTITNELSHFSLLTKNYNDVDLQFGSFVPEFLGDSVNVRVPYEMTLANESKEDRFNGEALFKMKYSQFAYLEIVGWEDFQTAETSGDSTWTFLRTLYF